MRILLAVNGLGFGGAERIVEALALGAIERGHRVEVAVTTREGPIAESLRAGGVPVHLLGIRSPLDLRVIPALVKISRRFDPDVINSHLAVSDLVTAFAAPWLGRARRISTVHNPGVELDPIKRALWHRALPSFERVVAVGEAVRRSLPSGLCTELLRPSLVDPDRPLLSRQEARARLGVPLDVPLVLAIGRLSEVKGFDVLAQAAALLATPEVRVMVIGGGPEEEKLRGTRLLLAGPRDDAAALLPAADVVACPSRSEGFPQVPLEAMAAGRPIVASHAGGLPEVVGDAGILLPPEDPAVLALAIDALLGDPERARRLGERGRARLEREGLTKTAMIDRMLSFYGG